MNISVDLLEKVGVPFVSGAVSFAGATLRFYMRIGKLQRDVKNFGKKLDAYVQQQSVIGRQLVDVVKRIELLERVDLETLRAGMRLEINNHRDELEAMIIEVRSSIRSVEDSSHDFAKEAALAQFMAQQHQRWEQIQRTLGRIEGFISKGVR